MNANGSGRVGTGRRLVAAAVLVLALVGLSTASIAAMVQVDPNDFADGTVLNSAFPNVTVAKWDSDIVVSGGAVTQVIAIGQSADPRVFALNGTFSSALVQGNWTGTSNMLRVDFLQGASSVTQDFANGVGFIQALAADGSVIQTLTSDFVSSFFQLTVTSSSAPIAYVYVSGGTTTGAQVTLTRLQYSPVPLPAAAWLLLSGLAGLGAMVRRKVH